MENLTENEKRIFVHGLLMDARADLSFALEKIERGAGTISIKKDTKTVQARVARALEILGGMRP